MSHLNFILKRFFIGLFNSPVFLIQIKDGLATLTSGKVSNKFINDCQDVVRMEKVHSGFLWAETGQYGKPVIKASNEISPIGLQKIRNLWSFYS